MDADKDFEPVIAAVFAKLKTVSPFKSASRRGKMPDQITEQPALFFFPHTFHYPPRDARGLDAVITIECDVFVYDRPDGETDDDFGAAMNGHLRRLHQAFAPDVLGRPYTAGGLAHDVRIEGEVPIDYGHSTGQAMLHAPIKILIP